MSAVTLTKITPGLSRVGAATIPATVRSVNNALVIPKSTSIPMATALCTRPHGCNGGEAGAGVGEGGAGAAGGLPHSGIGSGEDGSDPIVIVPEPRRPEEACDGPTLSRSFARVVMKATDTVATAPISATMTLAIAGSILAPYRYFSVDRFLEV
jgi:hypothetical protein